MYCGKYIPKQVPVRVPGIVWTIASVIARFLWSSEGVHSLDFLLTAKYSDDGIFSRSETKELDQHTGQAAERKIHTYTSLSLLRKWVDQATK